VPPDVGTNSEHARTGSRATSTIPYAWSAPYITDPCYAAAVYVALVVGTVLTIINQGDVLLAGEITPLVIAKILLTYLVPYSVSTFSALSANRVVETALKGSNRL
jgi:hypothetical protein